jgi:DNA-binding MarR family transcriptional regulator
MTLTQLNTAAHHSLNLTDLRVLNLLAANGRMCMTDLAAELALTESATCAAGKRLIAKCLVKKADRAADRFRDGRVVMLELAELGRVRLHQINGSFPEPSTR